MIVKDDLKYKLKNEFCCGTPSAARPGGRLHLCQPGAQRIMNFPPLPAWKNIPLAHAFLFAQIVILPRYGLFECRVRLPRVRGAGEFDGARGQGDGDFYRERARRRDGSRVWGGEIPRPDAWAVGERGSEETVRESVSVRGEWK